MGMFFTVFSFLKLLSVRGFCIKFFWLRYYFKKIYKYSLIYPFIELMLGLYYLSGNTNLFVCIFVIVIMVSQTYGVINILFGKKYKMCLYGRNYNEHI